MQPHFALFKCITYPTYLVLTVSTQVSRCLLLPEGRRVVVCQQVALSLSLCVFSLIHDGVCSREGFKYPVAAVGLAVFLPFSLSLCLPPCGAVRCTYT